GELLRFEEGPRERLAGDGAERLVLGPRGTRDVPACHALDVDPLAVLHEHRTARERAHLAKRLRKAPQVRRDDVVGDDLLGLPEPEARELREDFALVGDRRGQHDVERRKAIARDDDELVAAGLVHVADLPAPEEVRAADARLEKHAHSGRTPLRRSRQVDATSRATSAASPRYSSGRSRIRRSSGVNFLRYSRRSVSSVATSSSVRLPRSASRVSRRTASCPSGWPYFASRT